jgi:hypothetical protein
MQFFHSVPSLRTQLHILFQSDTVYASVPCFFMVTAAENEIPRFTPLFVISGRTNAVKMSSCDIIQALYITLLYNEKLLFDRKFLLFQNGW